MIDCVDYEEIEAGAATPAGLTQSKVLALGSTKGWVDVLVTAFPVVYRVDGAAPTSGTVLSAAVGAAIHLESRLVAGKFLALGVGGAAKLAAVYKKRV